MDRCGCGGQVDDNPEGFRVVSLLGVAPLERALFAQHRTLLVVGRGYSVTRPLGGVFFQVTPVVRTASAKSGSFSLRANLPGCCTASPTDAHASL
jgi:hypothetical protein